MTNYEITVDAPNAVGIDDGDETWSERFAAEPRIIHFYEAVASLADLETVSAVSRVQGLNDYRDGITADATQTTDAKEPRWLPSGGPGGRPAMEFERASGVSDELTLPGSWPNGTDWGMVVLFYAPSITINNIGLMGTAIADTGRFNLGILSAFGGLLRVGTNGTEAIAITNDLVAAQWNMLEGSWDLSAVTARVSANNEEVTTDVQVGAVVGTGAVYIGGDMSAGTETAKIACAIAVNVDLLNGDHEDLRQTFRNYFLDRFGLEY